MINPTYKRYEDGHMYFACPMCDSPHLWEELSPREVHHPYPEAPVMGYDVQCERCKWRWLLRTEVIELTPVVQDSRTYYFCRT